MNPSVSIRLLWAILLGVLLVRLGTLGLYPLMDTSEARYAEIARKMLASNDWITPMFDHGVPFWGKPPLSFWVQALSMKVLGIGEFASRFSSWLLHAASCLLIVRFASQERSLQVGLTAAIIYSTCSLGFLSSGAVLTDGALAFALLLAHGCSFCQAISTLAIVSVRSLWREWDSSMRLACGECETFPAPGGAPPKEQACAPRTVRPSPPSSPR